MSFHINSMFVLGLLRKLLRKCFTIPAGGFVFLLLSACILYQMYFYNVWEYARTLPFSQFRYPLEVNMTELVKKVLDHQLTGIEPLNDRHAFPYVINPDKKCKDEDGNSENIFMLMLIKSRMESFEQRRMIRRTWGREFGVTSVTVRRIFLLGINPTDKKLQHKIGLEHQDFGDIVQQFFVDTYFNNTLKMMMGFQWATDYCSSAQFIAFFDEDYFVNVNNAIKMLQTVKQTEYDNLVIGYVWENAMPFRVRGSKWYISLDEYPYRFYPTYVTAGSFFVPMMTADRIYAAMQFTKIIRFDDIFLGIVCYKLRTKLQNNPNLYFYDYPYETFKYRKVIAAHGFNDTELLYKAWKEQTDLDKAARKPA